MDARSAAGEVLFAHVGARRDPMAQSHAIAFPRYFRPRNA
jgi:hypothetical protein